MGYTSVRGSLESIQHAEKLIGAAIANVDDPIDVSQITEQLPVAIEKAMAEGSIYDPELGGLAIKQAQGDPIEAAFLLRAYRTTLQRLGYSIPSDTREVRVMRRVSATFKDIPGGQVLGETRDYTQRLLDFSLLKNERKEDPVKDEMAQPRTFPLVIDYLRNDGLLAPAPEKANEEEPFDVTRTPLKFPAPRSARLQVLSRGETGGMLAMAYGALRGYGASHAYVAEIRSGELPVKINHPVSGKAVQIGRIPVTECHSVNPGAGSLTEENMYEMTFGYGVTIGREERRAISMAIIEDTLTKFDGLGDQPVENDEYVLHHVDCVESTGFVEHLKLPHYVTFQSSLQQSRKVSDLMKKVRGNSKVGIGGGISSAEQPSSIATATVDTRPAQATHKHDDNPSGYHSHGGYIHSHDDDGGHGNE